MADLILHHYKSSPFAEKIRRVLAFKQLAWQSVNIPSIAPKPDVEALTGGYRKTPILQIGADIYCDTALICDVLEHRQPTPSLSPASHKGLARVLAQWADTTLFTTAMAYNFQPLGREQMFGSAPPGFAQAFADDRSHMTGTAPRLRFSDATTAYKSYLRRLATMLEDQAFLVGNTACLADFAAYAPLWFTRVNVSNIAGILDATSGVLSWMDRMAAFSQQEAGRMKSADAIAVAAAATPLDLADEVFQDDHGIPLGSQVRVHAESFGLEATEGELVAATRMHMTLRRVDARAGTVHVHFPRIGYVLRAL
ncbi:glutathione S-transferase family protein [Rhodoferax sp. WC2427]|uniref:glutathione S-transferase family protein n=1 Tax=Rhodoferax sp. WC2427 TaxID=3234144 RepID=UPI003466C40E